MTGSGRPVTESVAAARWRAACTALVDEGARFLSLHATEDGPALVVRALFETGSGLRMVSAITPDRALDALVEPIPAAGWDEREAHDRFGLVLIGHSPLRALVAHPPDLDAWAVPVHGEGVHQIAVGPVHAGVIESGHFRFHAVGERIVHLDLRLFYKHRGLEPAAEGEHLERAIAHAARACAACAVANAVAYAQACEAALGLAPDSGLRRARTMLLELERLYNHLNDLSAICAGIGFAPGAMAFAVLKERAQRLNAELVGHRFLFGQVHVARSDIALMGRVARSARAEVRSIVADAAACWREVHFSASVQDRLDGIGILSAVDAARLGAVGPVARASGIERDVRSRDGDRLWYGDFTPARPHAATGDVAARAELRATELARTGNLLEGLLAMPLDVGVARPGGVEQEIGVGQVESPRGETVCVVERAGRTLRRVRLRTGSYANWPALAHVVPGGLLPDFPLINKSFELCYACVDR